MAAISALAGGAVVPGAEAAQPPHPEAHACLGGAEDRAGVEPVAWDTLTNPIYSVDSTNDAEDLRVKDVALRLVRGQWRLIFSRGTRDGSDPPGGPGSAYAASPDLTQWSQQRVLLNSGSVDPTRLADGRYLLASQAPEASDGGADRPLQDREARDLSAAFLTPEDFADMSGPTVLPGEPLAPGMMEAGRRDIDVALAHTENGTFMIWKAEQTPAMAWLPPGNEVTSNAWQFLGYPAMIGHSENFQFVPIGGQWHLLTTHIPSAPEGAARGAQLFLGQGTDQPAHRTVLWRLAGDPGVPQSWLAWTDERELVVPQEAWNSPQDGSSDWERQNSAFLCDARDLDGFFYLVYAGSRELSSFEGRGFSSIGIARSSDLVTWEVPGGATAAPVGPPPLPGPPPPITAPNPCDSVFAGFC